MELTKENTFLELATVIRELDTEIKSLETDLKELKRQREQITDEILPSKMEEEGMQTINIKNVGRLSVRTEMRVSTVAAKKFELHDWLEQNGYEGLIGQSVNSSTLKSFVKECIQENRDYPDELLNIHTFERATLTKI